MRREAPLVILGAGRQGRNALLVAQASEREVLGFLDDTWPAGERVDGVLVLGGLELVGSPALAQAEHFVALGRGEDRRRIAHQVVRARLRLATLRHPSSVVSAWARIGAGSYVAPWVNLRSGARLGPGALVEAYVTLGVDARVGAFAGCGPGVQLTGGVRVGRLAYVGAGAVVTNEARVGARAIVGAGAVVLGATPAGSFFVGVPARAASRRGRAFPAP